MVIKSFFDGGNQADSTQYEVASLASISGTPDQWRRFTPDWKAVLKRHSAPWLHATDALTLNGPYTQRRGWDKTRVNEFISDCVSVINNHLTIPNIADRRKPGRVGLFPHVISIVLKDFNKARDVVPNFTQDATELLAVQSAFLIFERGKAGGAHFYYFTFDQNEPYMGHILDRKNNRKARRHLAPYLDRLQHIGQSDMRNVPALQVADLFAWSYSHKNHRPLYDWQKSLLKHRQWVDDWYDYDAMIKPIPGAGDIIKSWRLPKRKPTR